MRKFFYLDYTTIEKYGTGRLIYMLSKGADERAWAIIDSIYSFIDIGAKCVFFFILIATFNIRYAIAFGVWYILVLVVIHRINKGTIYRREKRRTAEEMVAKQLVRMIMSKQEVLQSHKTQEEIKYLDEQNDESNKANIRVNDYLRGMFNVPLILIYAIIVILLFYTVSNIKHWTFVFADFVAATTMIGYLMASTLRSTEVFKDITKNFTYIQKIRNFFDNTKTIQWYYKGKNFIYKQGDIDIKDVDFTYDEWSIVLENFTCNIQGGKKTAFVWWSGWGKSTILKLLAGYLHPDKWSIHVDKQDLSKTALKTYYPHIWYLTQEPTVFDGTVYENLIYALEGKPSKKIVDKAIKDAWCEFIYDFPKWLQTEIGERGIRLSGGQRQRLAIARIFLKDPEIILLDEPTSALDSISEEKIAEALHRLFEKRTVIIIAHRLQTVKEADDIIVIEDGEIVERGTHAQLVRKKGNYAKMLELQSWF